MKSKIKQIIFILVFIFLLFVLIFLSHIVFVPILNKLFFENYIVNISTENISDVFEIDKICLLRLCNFSCFFGLITEALNEYCLSKVREFELSRIDDTVVLLLSGGCCGDAISGCFLVKVLKLVEIVRSFLEPSCSLS